MLNKDTQREIRMMLERNWTIREIAHKLCIREAEVALAVKALC
jgi:DNA-directed RNA polymerase specialized sigma subunit